MPPTIVRCHPSAARAPTPSPRGVRGPPLSHPRGMEGRVRTSPRLALLSSHLRVCRQVKVESLPNIFSDFLGFKLANGQCLRPRSLLFPSEHSATAQLPKSSAVFPPGGCSYFLSKQAELAWNHGQIRMAVAVPVVRHLLPHTLPCPSSHFKGCCLVPVENAHQH